MKKRFIPTLMMLLFVRLLAPAGGYGQIPCCLQIEQITLLQEHIVHGLPGGHAPLLVRKGYVAAYDTLHRVPQWVAYHVIPAYRNTPKREGRLKTFRKDPDVDNAVVSDDYTNSGYARGHLAPFGVMGGDRDGDGIPAHPNSAESDPDDELTVRQANYMSNMAPQHQLSFNGSGGIWFKLERWIQDTLVERHNQEVWIYAGTIFGPGEIHAIGPDDDIGVPPLFYKMVITKDSTDALQVLAFLLPHHTYEKLEHMERHGEMPRHEHIEAYLVSVDIIEALTGLDFFQALEDDQEHALEKKDTWETWVAHYRDLDAQTASASQ